MLFTQLFRPGTKNSGHTLIIVLVIENRDSRYQLMLARESTPKGGGRGVGWFKGRQGMLCSKLDLSMGVTLSSCRSKYFVVLLLLVLP